jgi:hypothetical protein
VGDSFASRGLAYDSARSLGPIYPVAFSTIPSKRVIYFKMMSRKQGSFLILVLVRKLKNIDTSWATNRAVGDISPLVSIPKILLIFSLIKTIFFRATSLAFATNFFIALSYSLLLLNYLLGLSISQVLAGLSVIYIIADII